MTVGRINATLIERRYRNGALDRLWSGRSHCGRGFAGQRRALLL